METTIIKLGGNSSDSSMVVRSATFEEAFGDFSEARGKGRARRQARKLERQENKAERKVARQATKQAKIGAKQETRQLRRGGRQEGRIGRRATRKELRQGIRDEQQASRMGRRGARLDMRQQREDARQMREDTRVQGDESRENYMAEQEAYRESLQPQEEGQGGYAPQDDMGSAPQGGGGYEDQGGYAPQGGGGSQDDWGSAPSGYYEESEDQGGYAPQGGGGYEDAPSEGAYGDDNTYEGDYVQEEDEFGDDSYFNVEGMDGKSIVTPYVKETAQKLKNNSRAYNVLKAKRVNASANNNQTRGLDNLMDRTRTRIIELKSNLDNYCNADGNPTEMKRRRKEVNLALGRRLRRRNRVNQYAGSEVPVESDLSPEFSPNRIEVPPTSSFDAYSDLGRPVIVDGTTMSDKMDYTDDIMGDFEPTTIEMQSSFDGGSSNKNVIMSVAIGVGVGALALYLAKRQGWI